MHRPTSDPNTPKLSCADNSDLSASGTYPNPDSAPTQTSAQDLRLHTTDLILTLGAATLRRDLRVSSPVESLATSDDSLTTSDNRFDNILTTFGRPIDNLRTTYCAYINWQYDSTYVPLVPTENTLFDQTLCTADTSTTTRLSGNHSARLTSPIAEAQRHPHH